MVARACVRATVLVKKKRKKIIFLKPTQKQRCRNCWVKMRHRKWHFCGASNSMRHRKGVAFLHPAVGGGAHTFSVAHGLQCATESANIVAHGEEMRHKNKKFSVAHPHRCATEYYQWRMADQVRHKNTFYL